MLRLLAALYGLAAAVLIGVPVARACATPHEAAMFDVAGLKSELMVTALSCNADAQYNAFVTRFQAVLVADDQELNGYFLHTYGRAGQAAHDAYITNVANKMSEVGVNEGTEFCHRHLALFPMVLGLESPADLALFAASRGYVEPIAPARCTITVSDPSRVAEQR
jgi:hypothetical protein